MYSSEVFRASTFAVRLSAEPLARALAALRSAWTGIVDSSNKGADLHNVLRLDIVSALGQTPASYGWHVDPLLNVRMRTAAEPPAAPCEPSTDRHDPRPPGRARKAPIYRVPRRRQHPKLRVLIGGLAHDAA